MNILITGANGYIGQRLIQVLLQEEHQLYCCVRNKERFEELPSGTPLYTGKVAVRNNKVGELGLSYMGGIYNKWKSDGLIIDDKRQLHVFAIDFNSTIALTNTFLTAEWAWVRVQIPVTYSEQFGSRQSGGFMDVVQPVVKRKILVKVPKLGSVLVIKCLFDSGSKMS